jgi:hypothetical protein
MSGSVDQRVLARWQRALLPPEDRLPYDQSAYPCAISVINTAPKYHQKVLT